MSHFYHVYADGRWEQPVTEHFEALHRYGLMQHLTSVHVGYVGTPANIAAAKCTVEHYAPGYEIVAESREGWEQETLNPLWKFCQNADGLVSYAHTKGASRLNDIDYPWRRAMEYYCTVAWHRPVATLLLGKFIAGAGWFESDHQSPQHVPGFGNGGMFGGNFWWTHTELLRQNVPPSMESRYHAEHWLGQLSEVMPIVPETREDMHPGMLGQLETVPVW